MSSSLTLETFEFLFNTSIIENAQDEEAMLKLLTLIDTFFEAGF